MSAVVEFDGIDPNEPMQRDVVYILEAHGSFKPNANVQPLVEALQKQLPAAPEGTAWEVNPSDGPGIAFVVAGKRYGAGSDISYIKQVDAIRIPVKLVDKTE